MNTSPMMPFHWHLRTRSWRVWRSSRCCWIRNLKELGNGLGKGTDETDGEHETSPSPRLNTANSSFFLWISKDANEKRFSTMIHACSQSSAMWLERLLIGYTCPGAQRWFHYRAVWSPFFKKATFSASLVFITCFIWFIYFLLSPRCKLQIRSEASLATSSSDCCCVFGSDRTGAVHVFLTHTSVLWNVCHGLMWPLYTLKGSDCPHWFMLLLLLFLKSI